MVTLIDARLRREAARFSLRFSCEHCAHFDVAARACAHGYPSEPHRSSNLEGRSELEFCKEFELA